MSHECLFAGEVFQCVGNSQPLQLHLCEHTAELVLHWTALGESLSVVNNIIIIGMFRLEGDCGFVKCWTEERFYASSAHDQWSVLNAYFLLVSASVCHSISEYWIALYIFLLTISSEIDIDTVVSVLTIFVSGHYEPLKSLSLVLRDGANYKVLELQSSCAWTCQLWALS